MTNSILDSVKKVLGISPEYTEFDVDIIMHINTVFATLRQLGIGPIQGFRIETIPLSGTPSWGMLVSIQ